MLVWNSGLEIFADQCAHQRAGHPCSLLRHFITHCITASSSLHHCQWIASHHQVQHITACAAQQHIIVSSYDRIAPRTKRSRSNLLAHHFTYIL
jgi:hypothetical protein